CLQSNSAPFTF
nr:immunoglobulin light chain junction region [Macaca mulatta]MOW66055.1 immunoglobulin light chain junction region [Macaca mulatta]